MDLRDTDSGTNQRLVQLSRSLLAGRRDMRTDCLSAEDSNTQCSTTSRLVCVSSSGVQQGLMMMTLMMSADFLMQRVLEAQVSSVSGEVLCSLQGAELRLDSLRDRMEQLDHLSLQEVCHLWEQVEEEVKLKKMRIMELKVKLTEYESQRTDEIRAVLRKHRHLLENMGSLLPPDVHRLIHTKATVLNQSLLANRRSAARLLLLLQEENLQQESLLRLNWEENVGRWRRSRVSEVIESFRSVCSRAEDQQLTTVQQMNDLTEQRRDLIYKICSLVPPNCSVALVCDWFSQLTAVNQKIDSLYAELLHQLRCSCKQMWQQRLAEVKRCQEALSALQLSKEEVNDIVSSQLLTLIGRSQSQDEERLAALDVSCESVSNHTLSLSRCVFVVMRAAALLWETHSCRLESREEEIQQQLEDLQRSQQKHIQRKKVRLDDLLAGLRQESSEHALRTSLDRTVLYLQDHTLSFTQCLSEQWEVLERLHSVSLEELLSYSCSLSSFYQLTQTYAPTPEDLQNLHLSSTSLGLTRTLFFDHLEQHFHDVLSAAIAMVTDRKKVVSLEQELHLQQLSTEYIQTHICQPRLAELQLHQQGVQLHCEQVQEVLASCRAELQDLLTSISRRNMKFTNVLSNMEDDVQASNSSQRLEAVSAALQDHVDHHIRHSQSCESSFRQTLQLRMDGLRHKTAQVLGSFRLFSEGGDHSPQEVKLLKRRLTEQTKHISETEEAICSELDRFQSDSLRQMKEVSGRVEEKLCALRSEVIFMEKIQREISSSQVHIKAQAAFSNQQQTVISSKLEQVSKMMKNTQVSADQVCCVLSSVSEDLKRRCQYLDFELDSLTKSREQVRSAPPAGLLERSRTGVDLLDDPVVGIIRSLNRFSLIQESPAEPRPAGQSPAVRPPLRSTESVRAMKGGCRSIRTDRRFQVFGPKPKTEQNTHSFSSSVTSILWTTNDVLLLTAEDFYCSERHSRFQLLPDSLDQWADSMQQRLLGYQEQARRFLSTSREDLVKQLSVFDDLLRSLPSLLIGNYERQKEAALREVVGRVRKKMEEIVMASEQEKELNMRQLRACGGGGELQAVMSQEQERQERLHSAIHCSHLELQECVRAQGEEFMTSLASLTEELFCQLDDKLLTPTETEAVPPQHSEDSTINVEAGADPGQRSFVGCR
ncbi:hypothetical protein INR49_020470 [Caranx melampygus]|nr:hypothetical protein INR49_020470 [Caranx melampygus]